MRLADVPFRGRREAAALVEASAELVGQRLVLHELALARRGDRLLVEPDGRRVVAGDAGRLGGDQRMGAEEGLGAALRPLRELRFVSGELPVVGPPLLGDALSYTARRISAE